MMALLGKLVIDYGSFRRFYSDICIYKSRFND